MWHRCAIACLFSLTLGFGVLWAEPIRPMVKALPGEPGLRMRQIETIVVPAKMDSQLQSAVDDLLALYGERYGVDLLVVEAGSVDHPANALYLEIDSTAVQSTAPGAFVMKRARNRGFLIGADAEGLSNAIYVFCHEVMGARWYWPGELGFEWVGSPKRFFPESNRVNEPVYVMRKLHPTEPDFARRNRLIGRYSFNHALASIFNKEVYAQDPEVFAMVDGRRREPRGNRGTDPQPDFTNPRTLEITTDAVRSHFLEKPESESFSLSTNDNSEFDETAATAAVVSPVRYFRTRPDYTDLVFGFTSEVADRVFADPAMWQTPSGAPRYVTALAYFWTEAAPTIQLHPRVMPILTSDRAQWHDPAYRAEDKQLIVDWENSGVEALATWDYYFGAPYPYPRQFNQWIIESLRYMADHKVKAFFSQLPSAWGMDGAKAWLAAQLLWDPYQNGGPLLDEFYEAFFGPAAAPIRAFYEKAEAYRNEHEGKADWIKLYKNEAGIELFSKEFLQELRAEIEMAQSLVDADSRFGKRVQVVDDAFAFTEKYAAYEHARSRLLDEALQVEDSDALSIGTLRQFVAAREDFAVYGEALVAQSMHSRLKTFMSVSQTDPAPIWLDRYAQLGGDLSAVPAEYREVAQGASDYWAESKYYGEVLFNGQLQHGSAAPAKKNFLDPALPDLPDWRFFLRQSEGLTVGPADGEKKGIRVSGCSDAFVMTGFAAVSPGFPYHLDIKLRYGVSLDNITRLRLEWRASDGTLVRKDRPLFLPTGTSDGMVDFGFPLLVPEGASQLKIAFTVWRQSGDDFLEVHEARLSVLP